jgi:bile acid:Na+ symporter, BASS family
VLWAWIIPLLTKTYASAIIEVGMQNSGLGSSLAKTHFSMLAAAPCAISAFFQCIIGSALASYWNRSK